MTKHTLVLFKNKVKLEDVQTWTKYKFTLNPEYNPKDLETYDQFCKYIAKWLLSFKHANFTYCVEMSPVGRYHLHGYIIITDAFGFYSNEVKYLAPHNGLLGVEDPDFKGKTSWEDYCYKQQHLTGLGWQVIENVFESARTFKQVPKTPNDQVGFKGIHLATVYKEPTTPPNSPCIEYAEGYEEEFLKDDDEGYDMEDPDDDSISD